MATFECPVIRIHPEAHPDPEVHSLAVARYGGYQFITGKHYTDGQLGFYIPEGAIVPDRLIEEMELTGRLAGKAKNRVKAIKLRGVLSQGLFYGSQGASWDPAWQEGDNVAELLGIEKYEPPIPIQLQGKVRAVGPERAFWWAYDLEDVKKYPDLLVPGEEVRYTEKLHGTLLFLLVDLEREEVIVTSKGLAGRRLSIEKDSANTYWRAVEQHGLEWKMINYLVEQSASRAILFGEVVGVQDLTYGCDKGKGQIAFRAFDLLTELGGFLPPAKFDAFCERYDIPAVPTLYTGPYSPESLAEHTNGKSTLAAHLREGLVIAPMVERVDAKIGRVKLKSVSADYLTRKGEVTEFN